MALDQHELKQRRIKGLNKIATDLRNQSREIKALGIDVEQHMLEIHTHLDLILMKLGFVPKEPHTGPDRGSKEWPELRKQCRIIG